MQKREAKFTTAFLAWAREHVEAPAVFEIKSTRGKVVFYIRELKEHQRNSLLAAQQGKFPYKIPDVGIAHRPFDAILFGKMRAYVVISYPKHFYGISIAMMPESGVLTKEDAKRLAAFNG
jgi:hypothetical protein